MSATMSDIAARAGTSVAAVSVTLNGARSKTLRISEETRQRILEAAEHLGYRRNPLAGALATGRARALGLMLPDAVSYTTHDPFFSLVTTGVTHAASINGYNVMLFAAAGEDEGARAAAMIDRRIDGLVLVSPPAGTPIYAECERLGIPVVTVMAGPDQSPLSIDADDYAGGRIATEHLLRLGHRRIAHLSGRPSILTSRDRHQGYFDVLVEAGIVPDPAIRVPGQFNRQRGFESALQLLSQPASRRPTAVFAANDLSAHGAIDAAHALGLKVPQDLSVVGFDDTWYTTVTRPTLSSVHVNVPQFGERAAVMLIETLDGAAPAAECHVVLPVSLFVRESSGPFLAAGVS
jgi:LacI family transcriptional regulator